MNECLYCEKEFFPKNKRNPKWQKYCCKEHGRKHWRKLNPEKNHEQAVRARNNIYSDPNRLALLKEKSKIRNQTPNQRYRHYRSGAKSRNYPFELTFEQFMNLWGKPCSYCGSEIAKVGIDRLHNDLGYTEENSVPCCEICNKMKMILPLEIFLSQCNKIANRNSLRYSPI